MNNSFLFFASTGIVKIDANVYGYIYSFLRIRKVANEVNLQASILSRRKSLMDTERTLFSIVDCAFVIFYHFIVCAF